MESKTQHPVDPGIRNPPSSFIGILRHLGPGLIIAGSIVGSGELIATTRTGTEAGFSLLWLILIGCVIKVFVQLELGRFTVAEGVTTMEGLNLLPGPRWRVNWALWFWLAMFVVSIAQLGGVVGGVGQALAIARPLTSSGQQHNLEQDRATREQVARAILERGRISEQKRAEINRMLADLPPRRVISTVGRDDLYWAVIITVITAVLLVLGRYRFIQSFSMVLVALFTLTSMGTVYLLQSMDFWRISVDEILLGLSFSLPPAEPGGSVSPVATALAAFGIIGVGATELIQYPYWCLEKGYARWTGNPGESKEWNLRARGWLRVMTWDAWFSALVYTFATIAFFLLGAAVLGRIGLVPEGTAMIRTLTEMYVPVFGETAQAVFLFGALAVLYSTFFVATAGHARVCADAMRVFGFSKGGDRNLRFWTVVFSGLFPFAALFFYVCWREPVGLILASGVMQSLMLPVLGGAALFFRYRRCREGLKPGRIYDFFLWTSAAGLLIAGLWLAANRLL